MKKLYIIWMLLPACCTVAQNLQNANWVFGEKAELHFNPAPPSSSTTLPAGLTFLQQEGCATLSDTSGNILLVTDGTSLWHRFGGTYNLITSGLLGHFSGAQNIIIVPRPATPNHYYLFTNEGYQGKHGLYYSEIDLTSGLAQVVFLNTPLKDNAGVPVNAAYLNDGEAITATRHADGVQYWVAAHIRHSNASQLLSFLVTSNGVVNETPTFSSPTLISAFPTALKISPDTQKIAEVIGGVGVYLGTFNSTTGAINMNATAVGNTSGAFPVYGLEFSPNSSNLYYSYAGGLKAVDVAAPATEMTFSTGGVEALQLGIDNKIYSANFNSPTLSVISDPNNLVNPQFGYHTVPLNHNSRLGLPQLVPVQFTSCCLACCPAEQYLSSTILSNSYDLEQASSYIEATNIIANGGVGIYHAGDAVLLKNGFYAASGSKVHVYIEGCSGTYQYRTSASGDNELGLPIKDVGVKLAPNPTAGIFTISLEGTQDGLLQILDLNNVVVFKRFFKGQDSVEADISNQPNGLYVVRITSGDKIINEKIIKR